jgi:indolepyruvate ferredoxin oxidoreductase, beta subunit
MSKENNTGNKELKTKILVAGVGGQGVVFLTNLLVKAALLADIPVATSEIHGLSQRGGSVTAGITLGENTYGFLEKGGVDFLIGLEPLEAQRCVSYLHKNSKAVIDKNRILPYLVNSGHASYPDTDKYIHFLRDRISKVIYIDQELRDIPSVMRNIYTLGRICSEKDFPIGIEYIEQAIQELAKPGYEDKNLDVFRKGLIKNEKIIERR